MYKRKKWNGAIGYSLLIVVDVLTIFCDLGIDYCESAEKKALDSFIPFKRNGDQKALVDIINEAVNRGKLGEDVKDIIWEWSSEYDSFWDIMNLLKISQNL